MIIIWNKTSSCHLLVVCALICIRFSTIQHTSLIFDPRQTHSIHKTVKFSRFFHSTYHELETKPSSKFKMSSTTSPAATSSELEGTSSYAVHQRRFRRFKGSHTNTALREKVVEGGHPQTGYRIHQFPRRSGNFFRQIFDYFEICIDILTLAVKELSVVSAMFVNNVIMKRCVYCVVYCVHFSGWYFIFCMLCVCII